MSVELPNGYEPSETEEFMNEQQNGKNRLLSILVKHYHTFRKIVLKNRI